MNKVYFNKEKNYWFVSEPEDFYIFKSVNYSTNEEVNQILSWTRGYDMSQYPHHIRMYDVEIDNIKYFFIMSRFGNDFILESEDPIKLEDMIDEKNIFFTGETI
jgi:hypothetical protein